MALAGFAVGQPGETPSPLTQSLPRAVAARAVSSPEMAEVQTAHSFTGRMCAATRAEESQHPQALFQDLLAWHLAGVEGRRAPMGSWILVPRTRYGDNVLVSAYSRQKTPCRQLVLLGAGFDARAFRTFSSPEQSGQNGTLQLSDLTVFEVDQPTTFDVKEAILNYPNVKSRCPLTVKDRRVVPVDFTQQESWADKLLQNGFDPSVPTVWLLEGLLYYLSDSTVDDLARDVGRLSAANSVLFFDSVTHDYRYAGVAPGGAPFISGNDDYGRLWRKYGFEVVVHDFEHVRVSRERQRLEMATHAPLLPRHCRGKNKVLFVEGKKR